MRTVKITDGVIDLLEEHPSSSNVQALWHLVMWAAGATREHDNDTVTLLASERDFPVEIYASYKREGAEYNYFTMSGFRRLTDNGDGSFGPWEFHS